MLDVRWKVFFHNNNQQKFQPTKKQDGTNYTKMQTMILYWFQYSMELQKSENTYKTLKEYLYSQLPSLLTRKSQGSFVRRKAMKCTEYEKHKQRLLSVGYNNNNDVIGNSNLSIHSRWKDELHTVNQQVTLQETRPTDDIITYTSNMFWHMGMQEWNHRNASNHIATLCWHLISLKTSVRQQPFFLGRRISRRQRWKVIFFLGKNGTCAFFCLDIFFLWLFFSDRMTSYEQKPREIGIRDPKHPRNGCNLKSETPAKSESSLSTATRSVSWWDTRMQNISSSVFWCVLLINVCLDHIAYVLCMWQGENLKKVSKTWIYGSYSVNTILVVWQLADSFVS